MPDFTPTQGRYLSYIHAYTSGFGLPPAESEIAKAIGVAPPSVNQMMKMLQSKGLIHREPGVARSIEILVDESMIPKWTGRKITRVVTGWVMTKSRNQSKTGTMIRAAMTKQVAAKIKEVYVFKITLDDSKPPIWRRIETADVSLGKLHELIQTSMGWTNSHLHQFCIGEKRYMAPRALEFGIDWAIPYTGITISKLVTLHGPKLKFGYEYDFGDSWHHSVVLEKIIEPDAAVGYPRCTAGKLACPPEDVGGIGGFANFLDAINDPDDPEHEDKLEWSGPFDPAKFDKEQATANMKTGLPAW
jgi:DNA-binding transcriptional regulator YdaS (Cro superfamily)